MLPHATLSRAVLSLMAWLALTLLAGGGGALAAPSDRGESTTGTTTAAPAPAVARGAIAVRFGIADQHAAMYADQRWRDLGLRITRVNVPWDAATREQDVAWITELVRAAVAQGADPLVHLTGVSQQGRPERLPSVRAYERSARRLVRLLRPLGVDTWGVWNEANHHTQPTSRRPDRAAQYFLAMRRVCKGCRIVAADVLTHGKPSSRAKNSYRRWLTGFFDELGPRRARLVHVVGIHNYQDLALGRGASRARDVTRLVRRSSPRARFWLTETGGIAATRTRACSEVRQAVFVRRMFNHAAALRRSGVERLYMYNWTAHECGQQFDSGLIRRDGTARPAMEVVYQEAYKFRR